MAVKQTAGRNRLGVVAPKFAELNDDVLFGEVWAREDKLPLKMRSIVTVVTLVAKGMFDSSFEHHLMTAKANGVTRDEIAEILTHEAFYAGWPNAWAAFRMVLKVYGAEEDEGAQASFKPMFGMGQPNDAFAQYFIGNSYLNPLTSADTAGVALSNVTFEPGCRNNWHIHHADKGGGQVLIVTDGRGWYQEWGKEPQLLAPGDVVVIPEGVKHWHGAAADSWMSHIAYGVPGEKLLERVARAGKRRPISAGIDTPERAAPGGVWVARPGDGRRGCSLHVAAGTPSFFACARPLKACSSASAGTIAAQTRRGAARVAACGRRWYGRGATDGGGGALPVLQPCGLRVLSLPRYAARGSQLPVLFLPAVRAGSCVRRRVPLRGGAPRHQGLQRVHAAPSA